MLSLMKYSSLCLLTLGVMILVRMAFFVPVPMAVRLGHRGVQRRRKMEEGGLFATIEPWVRYFAGLIQHLPLTKLRVFQERQLMRADYCLGLTPDELSALSVISACLLGGSTYGMVKALDVTLLTVVLSALFGLLLPTLQLNEVIRSRTKVVTRGLPHAIEIAAMCMGAGLDFPGSLRQLCTGKSEHQDALTREFLVILERLELGQTRKEALRGFATRVQSPAVRDFVNAVIQAEEKGNPLAKVLQVQGRVLNMRRSVAAEEAAARAGVMLIGPMMLLVGCILLLLMGPFIVSGMGF